MDSPLSLLTAGVPPGVIAALLFVLAIGVVRLFQIRTQSPSTVPTPHPGAMLPVSSGDANEETESFLEARLREARVQFSHPRDWRGSRAVGDALEVLDSEAYDDAAIWEVVGRSHLWLSLIAVLVLLRRHGLEIEERVMTATSGPDGWTRYIILNELQALHEPRDRWVPSLLAALNASWFEETSFSALSDVVALRWQRGEELAPDEEFASWVEQLPEPQQGILRQLLGTLGTAVAGPWIEALQRYDMQRPSSVVPGVPNAGETGPSSSPFLVAAPAIDCGRVWRQEDLESLPRAQSHEALEKATERVLHGLRQIPPRPTVVVGAPRTGKSTLVRNAVRALLKGNWYVLEATPMAINAGMSFVGQLEARAQDLVETIAVGGRCLWVAPDFSSILSAGIATNDPHRNLANLLRQAFQSRGVYVLGECTRDEWTHACLEAPWLEECFEAIEVPVPDAPTTLGLVEQWYHEASKPSVDRSVLEEGWQLVRQFRQEAQRPGNLFDLMRRAEEDADRRAGNRASIQREDLLSSLSGNTGLPLELLDFEQHLDLAELEAHFHTRVQGQDEALRCVVDRLAMMKAGVTDPTRPLGVLLFAGPTGTGKTELAKALAEWLFGSESRLIRLDMSEFQDAGSLDTLLGHGHELGHVGSQRSFVDQVRRQPYSVVLLDEFEKAAPRIWDLFLQVFDDGRLSDRQGRMVDFRHCMIVLTTNLGGRPRFAGSLGFTARAVRFDPQLVHTALHESFRPEFMNRLDRVLVFRPLTREVMGRILRRQIEIAIQRRGLRDQPWAVEWDSAALEFLIDKGFSEELGARPLQRALERYVLTPLARRMVSHSTPAGDQFLFVTVRGEELAIDFVDPDAAPEEPAGLLAMETRESRSVRELALHARGTRAELSLLEEELGRLEEAVDLEQWTRARESELEMTSLPDFWKSPERFEVLELFASRERVERALHAARSLLNRLAQPSSKHPPREPLQKLALRLHLLSSALQDIEDRRPGEVLILVQTRPADRPGASMREFRERLAGMYRGWSTRRGAQLREWDPRTSRGDPVWVASIQSFGAWSLLHPEMGLHVWERHVPHAPNSTERDTLLVQVLPIAPSSEDAEIRAMAKKALADPAADAQRQVVRRYRAEPSPLVRDTVRGWRTGHLEWVLAGDFDLISPDPPA